MLVVSKDVSINSLPFNKEGEFTSLPGAPPGKMRLSKGYSNTKRYYNCYSHLLSLSFIKLFENRKYNRKTTL